MNDPPHSLLIVDNDRDLAMVLGSELAHAGYHCDLAASGDQALALIDAKSFDAIVTDWKMDGLDGSALLDSFAAAQPTLPVIVMTGSSENLSAKAIDSGAFHYVTKPLDVDELKGIIAQAIGAKEESSPTSKTMPRRDSLLAAGGASDAMLRKIDRLAAADSPVLIRGESGSGKELAARAIHDRSRRANAPFVAVNVAAIPENLLESELFGHVRGAFSGASQSREGLLMKAHRGTVLLDEIGEMPIGLQVKLLRVLQFGEVRPVGSDTTLPIDVRFFAATHRDLQALVRAGSFRDDLYFRLHVLELTVPALRDRKAEIPGLIAYFMSAARIRNPQSCVRSLSPDAIRALARLPWPGNVRELASVVERLVVMGDSAMLEYSDLALAGLDPESPPKTSEPPPFNTDEQLSSLEAMNRQHVDRVLAYTRGDKADAARILEINPSTLYRWIRAREA